MPSYRVILKDHTTEDIDDADAYQQEGQMTTFFRTGSGRNVVDTWSTRMASFRTTEILSIRRNEQVEQPQQLVAVGPAAAELRTA